MSSTPPTWCSGGSPSRSRRCCAASTSPPTPRTSTTASDKATKKLAYRHSGYPGGLSSTPYGELLAKDPRQAIEKSVWGMLPKNRLSRQLMRKLKVYAGPEHPHQAQKATPYEITQISQ